MSSEYDMCRRKGIVCAGYFFAKLTIISTFRRSVSMLLFVYKVKPFFKTVKTFNKK